MEAENRKEKEIEGDDSGKSGIATTILGSETMSSDNVQEEAVATVQGPKFTIDIEGTLYDWDEETITMEQIAELGGWDPSQGVIEIDKDNDERTLQPGEVVQLKPGMGFSKKVHWKRGLIPDERIRQELEMIRSRYPDCEFRDGWFRIKSYPLPPGWNREATDVASFLQAGFPSVGPYGIYVPLGLRHGNAGLTSYAEPANPQPPFDGTWGILSWAPAKWHPAAEPRKGDNLLNWVEGFTCRFQEGA